MLEVHVGGEAILAAVFLASLAACSVIDVRRRIVPNGLVVFLCALWVLRSTLRLAMGGRSVLGEVVLPVACAFALCFLLLLLALGMEALSGKSEFGGGDIKLFFAAFLFVGPQGCLPCLFGSCVAGIFLAMVYLVRGKRTFPFVPCIAVGVVFSYLTLL